jgi:hypothetical protein
MLVLLVLLVLVLLVAVLFVLVVLVVLPAVLHATRCASLALSIHAPPEQQETSQRLHRSAWRYYCSMEVLLQHGGTTAAWRYYLLAGVSQKPSR